MNIDAQEISRRSPLKVRWAAHKFTVVTIGVLGSAVICYFDYRTGPNLSFLIFYFLPVLFVLWYAGSFPGISVALGSAVAWIAIDRLARHPESRLLVADWNWLRAAMFILVAYLLSLWKSFLDQQEELAFEDPLTRLGNRRAFRECAQHEIDRASRYCQPLTVAFLDIDDFKLFNDQRGHEEGDKLLAEVGHKLQENLRSIDMAARVGGDEFVILFPQIGPSAGRSAIEKIHGKLMESMRDRHWPVSFSIGAVTFLETPRSVEELLRQADERMYGVKRMGKGGWKFDVLVA